jgi:hypothetical protein
MPVICLFVVFSLLGMGLAAWAVRATLHAHHDGETDAAHVLLAAPKGGVEALLAEFEGQMEPVLTESRRILLGQRPVGDPTCVTQHLDGNKVLFQGSPDGGAGLRIMAFYVDSPEMPLALYRWSQERLRPFLQAERDANASALVEAERLAASAAALASEIRKVRLAGVGDGQGPAASDAAEGAGEEPPLAMYHRWEPILLPAWPAECLRRLRTAVVEGDAPSSRIWADELAAATFALADLHRWLNLLLDSHLTSLDFQARCRVAFAWTESLGEGPQDMYDSCLPAAGTMATWGQNYLEVEHQAERLFGPPATAVSAVESVDLSGIPSARWMPTEIREAFLALRSRLSPSLQAVWDLAATAPFERSYLANVLFRTASARALGQVGVVLQRFSQSHTTATVAELMDVLFYRAGLYSSGYHWADRYDPRLLDAAGAIVGRREQVALRAHRLANSLLKDWKNYSGDARTLVQVLDTGLIDCITGTDLIGALYRNAGQGEYLLVRLNCGSAGHSVGAVPIEDNGDRRLLILDSLSARLPGEIWPSAYFQGLTWPEGYPGRRGLLFSAELYVRGLDGYVFAEGYVVRGEHAGQWMRAALPHLPGFERAKSARIFNGPYPPSPIPSP